VESGRARNAHALLEPWEKNKDEGEPRRGGTDILTLGSCTGARKRPVCPPGSEQIAPPCRTWKLLPTIATARDEVEVSTAMNPAQQLRMNRSQNK
jgi:hypothetical protein